MYVCIYICIYIYIYIFDLCDVDACVTKPGLCYYTHSRNRNCALIHTYTCFYMHIYIHAYIYAKIYMLTHMHIHLYIRIYNTERRYLTIAVMGLRWPHVPKQHTQDWNDEVVRHAVGKEGKDKTSGHDHGYSETCLYVYVCACCVCISIRTGIRCS
jgi:hypothetical protein